ncbi:heat shock protein Hsp-16.1/Hsp-16.11-like [Macrobrachium rosenbergii]|uniref:heat shock protein Hsp-16.1/Hsp-16.11-like n=1 Tax=Macrobrachium rosenbergii TaxID=79674 RepID=UPI0034D47234
MSATRIARHLGGVRRILHLNKHGGGRPVICVLMKPSSSQVRHFYRGGFGRDSPFTQMEEFMKDMEKKFRRDMDSLFRDLPRVIESGMPRLTEVKPRPRFGEVQDISTPETYKLAFNFPNADAENVKVSLKGRTLTVTGSVEEVTETSRSSRQVSLQYDIPEGVNLDALESCMSHDGVLTVEAPQILPEPPNAPKTINIERE